jgi:hypothetical protein
MRETAAVILKTVVISGAMIITTGKIRAKNIQRLL